MSLSGLCLATLLHEIAKIPEEIQTNIIIAGFLHLYSFLYINLIIENIYHYLLLVKFNLLISDDAVNYELSMNYAIDDPC